MMGFFYFIFSLILQIGYVDLRISRSISDSPLNFEITRVDCICYFKIFINNRSYLMFKWRTVFNMTIQPTLVISKYKRLSELLRDIRTSTYQICSIEEKMNETTTTTFNKLICYSTPKVRDILKI